MPRFIEIKKLFAFCTVCENLSFSKAARSLNLGQSTISHHIATLESELKIELFKRTSRSVELTHEGEKIYAYAQKIFEAFKNFENYLAVKNTEPIGKLCIYGGENSLLSLVVGSIQPFQQQYPKIDFDIVSITKVPLFLSHHLSVGIMGKIETQPNIIQEYLMTFHLGLYASKAYMNRFGEPKSVADLKSHHLISFENHEIPSLILDDWFLSLGFSKDKRSHPGITINTVPLTFYAAYEGLGIVTIPRESFFLKQYDLVEILPETQKPILPTYLTYHQVHKNHPSITAFEKHLRKVVEEKGWS